MNPLHKYDIPFVGLKQGEHRFTYTVKGDFYELFEASPVQQSNIVVDLDFDKKSNFFQLRFYVDGTVQTDCDRCAESFDLPIEGTYDMIVKFNDALVETNEFEEEIMYLSYNDTHLNVAKLIYEFIILSMPMQKTHPDDEDGNPGCELLWNNDDNDSSDDKDNDPRWDALKNLKNN